MSLSITVEPTAGGTIQQACVDMCELANRMGIVVEARLNDVLTIAWPETDPYKLHKAFQDVMNSTNKYKIAVVPQ